MSLELAILKLAGAVATSADVARQALDHWKKINPPPPAARLIITPATPERK